MRTLMTLLTLSIAPVAMLAQTDTSQAEPARKQTLSVGVNSKEGAYAEVRSDADTTGKSDPIIITTKRKKITITSEPRHWASVDDSIQDVLRELRTQRRNQFTYWSGLDLGVNTLLGPDGDADLDEDADFMQIDNSRSRFFAINFMEQKIEFGSHHAGLLTGLGLEWCNYRLENNDMLMYNADSVYGVPVESPEFRKNKLRQTGLRVPLMLEFNTKRAKMPTREELLAAARDTVRVLKKGEDGPFDFNNRRNFHIAVGVVGSWYFESMYKVKYQQDGETRKQRDSGDYHLLPYRLAASVRIGYGSLNLFAEYALTPLFKDGKGPELTPLNIGITIIGFN